MNRGRLVSAALVTARSLANSGWNLMSSSDPATTAKFVASATNYCHSRGYYGGGGVTNDEFWAVEGEIMRIKTDHENKSLLKWTKRKEPQENLNLSRKTRAHMRIQRVQATRLTKTVTGQEEYWKTYLKRFQSVRDQWEKLFWDGVPEEEPRAVKVDKNDPFTILGLKRRDKPYSPVELRSAYREMALKFHPDHNPAKDAEAKFEKIWNAYKMLQHKRSWR